LHAYLDTVDSPAGPLTFAVDAAGSLLALSFLDGTSEETMEQELARRGYHPAPDTDRTAPARRELSEYAAGHRRRFTLPLALAGTPWQLAVWEALTRIPYGETRTYGQVAASLGRPTAARAVGRANATNRFPLVVPCHRVVGADGTLTGFAGGTHLKALLLAHEIRTLAATAG